MQEKAKLIVNASAQSRMQTGAPRWLRKKTIHKTSVAHRMSCAAICSWTWVAKDSRKFAEALQFFQKGNVGLILGTIRRPLGCQQMRTGQTFHRRSLFRWPDARRRFRLVKTRHPGQAEMKLQDAPARLVGLDRSE